MSWLVCDGTVLASLEKAETWSDRRRGLLGRDGLEGALLLCPTRAVHTLGMRFPIDVAWCDHDLVVLRVKTMARHRVGLPMWRSRSVIEAEAGSFHRWGLSVGDQLEIRS
ncbi:MAG: DUF192 domain-containing protein [Acidimicrobiia bacterium]|nr:DUF192 domain-containing protein [Acidimicrobiia bacterium]MDH5239090.1 DUF192 domain-containing protein [Acidimicrobiia bacterium]